MYNRRLISYTIFLQITIDLRNQVCTKTTFNMDFRETLMIARSSSMRIKDRIKQEVYDHPKIQ